MTDMLAATRPETRPRGAPATPGSQAETKTVLIAQLSSKRGTVPTTPAASSCRWRPLMLPLVVFSNLRRVRLPHDISQVRSSPWQPLGLLIMACAPILLLASHSPIHEGHEAKFTQTPCNLLYSGFLTVGIPVPSLHTEHSTPAHPRIMFHVCSGTPFLPLFCLVFNQFWPFLQ